MKHKHTLMTTFMLLFAGSLMSQSVTFHPGNSLTQNVDADKYSIISCHILNKTPDSLDVEWTLVSNNLINGWDYSLCDFGTCYIGVPTKGTMKRMSVSDTAFLKLNINPAQILGTGSVTFKIFIPVSGQSYNVTLTINVYPLGTIEHTVFETVSIYPNPVNNLVTIENSFVQPENISVYNVIGEKLIDFVASPGEKSDINISSLPDGLYFVKYHHSSGNVITKKIVKN